MNYNILDKLPAGISLQDLPWLAEMGDLFWYCAIIADQLNINFDEIMEKNIAKLKARYGDKFSETKAEKRDLASERTILES